MRMVLNVKASAINEFPARALYVYSIVRRQTENKEQMFLKKFNVLVISNVDLETPGYCFVLLASTFQLFCYNLQQK